jgi:hypothetical protein
LLNVQLFIGIVATITFPEPYLRLLFKFFLQLFFLVVFVSIAFPAKIFYVDIIIVTFFTSPQLWLIVTAKQVFLNSHSLSNTIIHEIFRAACTFVYKLDFSI